jgi:copper chaperone
MNTVVLTVTGMSCMGCVNSVKNLLTAVPGVQRVAVDLASGRVTVDCQAGQADVHALKQAVLNGGYGIAG